MNSDLLFYLGCIPFRFILVLIAYKKYYLEYLKYLALLIGISFLVLYFGGYRKTGFEAKNGIIWWNNYRLIHGFNYLIFYVLCNLDINNAYLILLFDLLIGIFAKLLN
jgi:hypothetical protein